MREIILASASPRRKDILKQVGIPFTVYPSNKEEIISKSIPSELVEELSLQKALDVAEQLPLAEGTERLIIGADTLVALDNQILGKPKDEEDAERMLTMLQGQKHQVLTGVSLILEEGKQRLQVTFHEKTDVVMHQMEHSQIKEYIATKEPMDKAGAYAIQGRCAIYIKEIHGDYYNVVGFPAARFMQELARLEQQKKTETEVI